MHSLTGTTRSSGRAGCTRARRQSQKHLVMLPARPRTFRTRRGYSEGDPAAENKVCYPGSVTIDNKGHAKFTKVTVEVRSMCVSVCVGGLGCLLDHCMPDPDAAARHHTTPLQSADYPGLLRVIAWVMNGLGLRVHTATLTSSDEGFAEVRD